MYLFLKILKIHIYQLNLFLYIFELFFSSKKKVLNVEKLKNKYEKLI